MLSVYENAEPTMKSGCPSQCLGCHGRGKVRTKGSSFPSPISLSSFIYLFIIFAKFIRVW
jgi:cytochrome c553